MVLLYHFGWEIARVFGILFEKEFEENTKGRCPLEFVTETLSLRTFFAFLSLKKETLAKKVTRDETLSGFLFAKTRDAFPLDPRERVDHTM